MVEALSDERPTDQLHAMAHLRPIERPRCSECPFPATHFLYNGLNDKLAAYCQGDGVSALARFKEGRPL